ncbi:MAG: SoxR reducing system RseC family protein [Ignavibacteriales bacterium]|nr:SoxR reducing system RseC family protein [Ignavibacteriales bacterium]
MPLILILAGLFLGMQVFQINKELFSTLLAVGLVLAYTSIILFVDKKKKHDIRSYPQIVFVNRKVSND